MLWDGKVLLVGGKVAVHDDLCCCPGVDAAPGVTVTITGACADEDDCDKADSTYLAYSLFSTVAEDEYFLWHYTAGAAFSKFDLVCVHPAAGVAKEWCAALTSVNEEAQFGVAAADCSMSLYGGALTLTDVTGQGITLVGGTITGTIVLPGDNFGGGFDCSGCTATVVMS